MSRDPSKLRVNIALMRWQSGNRYASFVNSPDQIQAGNFLLNSSIYISYCLWNIECTIVQTQDKAGKKQVPKLFSEK